jgi:hypothetical protein
VGTGVEAAPSNGIRSRISACSPYLFFFAARGERWLRVRRTAPAVHLSRLRRSKHGGSRRFDLSPLGLSSAAVASRSATPRRCPKGHDKGPPLPTSHSEGGSPVTEPPQAATGMRGEGGSRSDGGDLCRTDIGAERELPGMIGIGSTDAPQFIEISNESPVSHGDQQVDGGEEWEA